jgi:hypothetical protein
MLFPINKLLKPSKDGDNKMNNLKKLFWLLYQAKLEQQKQKLSQAK